MCIFPVAELTVFVHTHRPKEYHCNLLQFVVHPPAFRVTIHLDGSTVPQRPCRALSSRIVRQLSQTVTDRNHSERSTGACFSLRQLFTRITVMLHDLVSGVRALARPNTSCCLSSYTLRTLPPGKAPGRYRGVSSVPLSGPEVRHVPRSAPGSARATRWQHRVARSPRPWVPVPRDCHPWPRFSSPQACGKKRSDGSQRRSNGRCLQRQRVSEASRR